MNVLLECLDQVKHETYTVVPPPATPRAYKDISYELVDAYDVLHIKYSSKTYNTSNAYICTRTVYASMKSELLQTNIN